MAFGNYDAGQSRPVSNPLFGGVRKTGIENGFIQGMKIFNPAAEDVRMGTSIQKTTVPVEARIAEQTEVASQALASVAEQADYDRQVDEMFAPYITPETRERMASTSFNAAMMLNAFDDAYKLMAS